MGETAAPSGRNHRPAASLLDYRKMERQEPDMSPLSLLLNVLWIVFGGLYMAAGWLIAAVIMVVTIIGKAARGNRTSDTLR